jgi:hypothetical protein
MGGVWVTVTLRLYPERVETKDAMGVPAALDQLTPSCRASSLFRRAYLSTSGLPIFSTDFYLFEGA